MTLSKSPRPGGIQHTIHNKPSSPIQIPRRRRPMSSMNNSSPIGRQVSPDLIFEMSPVPTDFPSPSHYALGSANQSSIWTPMSPSCILSPRSPFKETFLLDSGHHRFKRQYAQFRRLLLSSPFPPPPRHTAAHKFLFRGMTMTCCPLH